MKLIAGVLFSIFAFTMVACGGLSDDTKLSEVSDDDAADLCSEVVAASKDCGNGVKVTRKGSADCAAGIKALPDSCTATVGDFHTCNEVDVCEILTNSACALIAQCALQK
jgi:hypothetical protein